MTIPQNHRILFEVLRNLFSQDYEDLDEQTRDMYFVLSDMLVNFEVKDTESLNEFESVKHFFR